MNEVKLHLVLSTMKKNKLFYRLLTYFLLRGLIKRSE